MLPIAEIERRDLLNSCLHELAHRLIANHFGIPSFVTVTKTNTDNPVCQKTYVGKCDTFRRMPRRARILIGLAGVIAEALFEDGDLSGADIVDYLAYGDMELSESDAVLAAGYTDRHVEQCLELVRAGWDDLSTAARRSALNIEQDASGAIGWCIAPVEPLDGVDESKLRR